MTFGLHSILSDNSYNYVISKQIELGSPKMKRFDCGGDAVAVVVANINISERTCMQVQEISKSESPYTYEHAYSL